MGKMRLTANILFAGIGCQDRGLENTGVIDLDVRAIAEIDKDAILSYAAVHKGLTKEMIAGYDAYPDTERMIQELKDKNIGYDAKTGKPFDWDKIRKNREYTIKKHWLASYLSRNLGDISRIRSLPEADLWTISFPCQDISVAGKQKGFKEGTETKSSLLWEQIRLLETAVKEGTSPKFLLFENVAQLVGEKYREDFTELLARLDNLGYQSVWKVLDAKNCGIPQSRKRAFVVCARKGINMDTFTFPAPYRCDVKLDSILDPAAGRSIPLDMDRLAAITAMLREGSGCPDIKLESIDTAGDEPAGMADKKAVDGKKKDTYMVSRLTPAMSFQLMGLTADDARKCRALGVSDTQLCRQAGNGIVTNCIQLIGEHLYKALEDPAFVCTDERMNDMHRSVAGQSDVGAVYENFTLQDLAAEIREALQGIKRGYLQVGWILKKIKEAELYKEEGFQNIHKFARHYFNLPQSAVSRFIRIFDEFSVGDRPELQERYRAYNLSQLVELLPMKKELRNQVTPEMSVTQIRKLKSAGTEKNRKAKTEADVDSGNRKRPDESPKQDSRDIFPSVDGGDRKELPDFLGDEERMAWIGAVEAWGLWYTDPNIQTDYYKFDFRDGSRLVAAKRRRVGSSYDAGNSDDIHYHMVFSDRYMETHRDGYLAGYKNHCMFYATPVETIISFLHELDEGTETVEDVDEGYILNGYVMEEFDPDNLEKAESFVGKKYTEFYEKHGYIPKYFNVKNCREIDICAMTLCTSSGSATGIGGIIFFDAAKEAAAVINNRAIDVKTACRLIRKILRVVEPQEREKVEEMLKRVREDIHSASGQEERQAWHDRPDERLGQTGEWLDKAGNDHMFLKPEASNPADTDHSAIPDGMYQQFQGQYDKNAIGWPEGRGFTIMPPFRGSKWPCSPAIILVRQGFTAGCRRQQESCDIAAFYSRGHLPDDAEARHPAALAAGV